MGVHAGQLALKSDLRLVQEYRRSLLPCLEQARRPTLDHHVYRSSGLGVWVLISENWYYAMGNMSFCSIARLLGVSDVAVLKWVRNEARRLPEPAVTAETVIITLDEMWHFLKKRLTSFGFGARLTLSLTAPSPGCLVAVMTPPVKSSSIKSASKAKPSSPTTGKGSIGLPPKTNSSPAKT